MSDRKNPPKAIQIVEYWDKQPLIKLKDGYWNPMSDVGEPSCQACNSWNPEWDIGEFTDSYEEGRRAGGRVRYRRAKDIVGGLLSNG